MLRAVDIMLTPNNLFGIRQSSMGVMFGYFDRQARGSEFDELRLEAFGVKELTRQARFFSSTRN